MTKRTLILFIAHLCFFPAIFGQIDVREKKLTNQFFYGEVHLFTLFIDTWEGRWDDAEREYYQKELAKSQTWLREEATVYDQEIQFNNDYFFKNGDVVYLPVVDFSNSETAWDRALVELGYKDFNDFLTRNNFDFSQKKLKVLLFVKSKNRSHAWNRPSGEADVAILYHQSGFGMLTDHYTISHEMLHQFGAWDLYYGQSQSLEKATKANELYPHSIMANSLIEQELLEVDELTAWLIGWHNKYKDEYMEFKPVYANREDGQDARSIKFDLKKKDD